MRYAILITLLMLFAGCNKDQKDDTINYSGENCIDNNEGFIPEDIPDSDNYKLTFYKDSKISIAEFDYHNYASIEAGHNIVFLYKYTYDDDPLVADDEFSEEVLFEIDPDINNFIISGDDLRKANSILGILCYCDPAGHLWITDGCIKGRKINENEWQIDINIFTTKRNRNFSKMLSERFIAE